MALTTLDGLIAAMAASAAQQRSFLLDNTLGSAAVGFQDQWTQPHLWSEAAPTYPTGAGALTSNTTVGALPLAAPAGGNSLYLARASGGSYLQGGILLFDRLWHVGALDATLTTLQTITGATITRATDDVEVWAVTQVASNFTAPNITLNYTNSAGASGRSGVTPTPNFALHQIWQAFPLCLQAGDYGVQSVQSVQLSAGGGAGSQFALVALKRIAMLPVPAAGFSSVSDCLQLGLPKIDTSACLSVFLFNNGSTASIADGQLTIVEG